MESNQCHTQGTYHTVLTNVIIVTDGQLLTGKAIVIADGGILSIIEQSSIDESLLLESFSSSAIVMDMGNSYCSPGLIDLQVYGSGGVLFGGPSSLEALQQMEQDLCQQGTTGFLATIATNTFEVIHAGLDAAKQHLPHRLGNFWGVHLEGPYISPLKRGAHPEALIRQASFFEVESLLKHTDAGILRMMTLAPERVGRDVLDLLAGHGVIISAGHSNATYSEGIAALGPNKPVQAVTHLFNAMPPMLHREPDMGYIPAIFEQQPYTSIIADGEHVHFSMIGVAKRLLGERLFLITDAVTETSQQQGISPHILQVLPATSSGGMQRRRYVTPDGGLSGSALTMLQAVRNCVVHCSIALPEAINMASLYPAQLLGLAPTPTPPATVTAAVTAPPTTPVAVAAGQQGKKGRVAEGYDADLCIFNDKFEVIATFIAGNIVFRRDS